MSPQPIQYSAEHIDLSPRYFYSVTVAASPALAAETTIATLTVNGDLAIGEGIRLTGWAAFTVGTSGVSAQLRIRQTGLSGTVVADSGATSASAASLGVRDALGIDTAAALPGQVYVLTLQVASGAAESTVSAVLLDAFVI